MSDDEFHLYLFAFFFTYYPELSSKKLTFTCFKALILTAQTKIKYLSHGE